MNDLLLHPQTKQGLEQLAESQAHAALIMGELGAGKYTAAKQLANNLLQVDDSDKAPYYLHISSDNKGISIDQIRDLQSFVQLKTTGSSSIRRVAVIESADTMSTEAQNALLKLLEEPPDDTVIILTASQPQNLRPTILSRVQKAQITRPDKEAAINHFVKRGHSSQQIEKMYGVSNGQVGLLSALLEESDNHVLANHITLAKKLYGMDTYQRLAKVDELSKQKEDLSGLLFACKRICSSALEQAATKDQISSVKAWHRQLKLVINAENSLKHNPNTKLLLTDLFVSM